ncbi:MAG: DNA recombination protein RmuC, partial [Candidatus Poribacteria bacterium]
MNFTWGLFLGFILGAVIISIINYFLQRQKKQEKNELTKMMEGSFAKLSSDALTQTKQDFLQFAEQTLSKQTQQGKSELETKKLLINQTLEKMETELKGVGDLVNKHEKDRAEKYGELAEQLRNTADQTKELQKTTSQLSAALYNTKVRGQLGEKIA